MIGTACGKVILVGEHAVVYGVPALVAGIERGARATAVVADGDVGDSELIVHFGLAALGVPRTGSAALASRRVRREEEGRVRVEPNDGTELGRAFFALLERSGTRTRVSVEVSTDLPPAAGLGCSAALGVAIARALGSPAESFDVATVVDRAMAWERVFHGTPSGVDVHAAASGGCFEYQRGEDGARTSGVALGRPLCLAIGHTGVASATRSMVEQVARLRDRDPDLVRGAFEGLASEVGRARAAIASGDLAALGRSMSEAQRRLTALSLSTPEIESLCRVAREAGALGCKVTGAGGGGCVIALTEGCADSVLEAWERAGFSGFSTRVAMDTGPLRP